MPKLEKLNALVGSYVNLEYRLLNGSSVKFLDDAKTYLGNQLTCEFGGDRCFGVIANMDFLLVSTYEENGANPELILYKKRQTVSGYRNRCFFEAVIKKMHTPNKLESNLIVSKSASGLTSFAELNRLLHQNLLSVVVKNGTHWIRCIFSIFSEKIV